MAIDIGHEPHLAPHAGITERPGSQTHPPVAAPNSNMHDIAPAALGIRRAHPFIHARTLGLHVTWRIGRTQGRMPGRTTLGEVDRFARKQARALPLQAAPAQHCPARPHHFPPPPLPTDPHTPPPPRAPPRPPPPPPPPPP